MSNGVVVLRRHDDHAGQPAQAGKSAQAAPEWLIEAYRRCSVER